MDNDTVSCADPTPDEQLIPAHVKIPLWVAGSGISGAAVKLYCAIATLAHTNGRTPHVTRDVLAFIVMTSTRTVSAHLRELVQIGAVEVIPQYDGSSRSGSVYVLLEKGKA